MQAAALSPSQSRATGDGLFSARAGGTATVTLTPCDAFGNAWVGAPLDVGVHVTRVSTGPEDVLKGGREGGAESWVEFLGDGRVLVSYTATQVCSARHQAYSAWSQETHARTHVCRQAQAQAQARAQAQAHAQARAKAQEHTCSRTHTHSQDFKHEDCNACSCTLAHALVLNSAEASHRICCHIYKQYAHVWSKEFCM